MNKIEIIYNNHNYSFIIDKYKILYGNNFRDKFNIIKCLKQYFNKYQYSEYGQENLNRTNIRIDEHNVDIKNTFFYEMTCNYDLNNDQKLLTKSLILKYLEFQLDKIEYEEEFITIKSLLEDFVSLTLKDIIDINIDDNVNFELRLGELNYKTLIKLIEPILLKESFEINNYDLSYEESYIIQIKLLEKIAKKIDKKVFVVADIPLLTDKILNHLESLENIYMIIFSNTYNSISKIENYLLVDFDMLDLMDNEVISDYIMNLPWHTTIEQLKDKFKENMKNFELKHLIYNKKI